MEHILNLINDNNWTTAIKNIKNLFDPISDGKNLFHYACMRGETKVINHFVSLSSNLIFLSDDDGNTGAHLLAINGWDKLLIDLVRDKSMFLQLKNNDDKFIFNLVFSRHETLSKIIDLMLLLNHTEYLNYVNNENRNLILNIINEIYDETSPYFNILVKLSEIQHINFNLPKESPPLIVAITEKKMCVIKFLLEKIKNINVNIKSSSQFTPLIVAIMNDMTDISLKLIDMRADINYGGSENKFIPLIVSIKRGQIDTIEKILQTDNLNYDKADFSLNSPIFYMIHYVNTYRGKYNNEPRLKVILKRMIQKSNLSERNISGVTPLHLLVKYKLWKDFEADLVLKKINIDAIDRDSETPFSHSDDKDVASFTHIIKTVEKMDDIILPEIDSSNSNHGLFNSDGVHNVMYMLYILNTYNKCTIPVQYPNIEKETWEKYKLYTQMTQQNSVIELFSSIVLFYVEIFHSILPHLMFWTDKNINFRCDDANFYLQEAIRSDKRFIVIKLSLIQHSLISHANILIYDKDRNVIVRFEPYGDWEFIDSYFLDKEILKFFKKAIDKSKHKTLKFLRPSDYLNKTKFQSASLGDSTSHKHLGDPDGYCLAWCYWFLELKLINPEIDERILVEKALKKIILFSDKTDDNPLLSHIRSYAKHLDNEKNKILEKMNIYKHDFYKVSYDDNKFNLFKKFVEKFVINFKQ